MAGGKLRRLVISIAVLGLAAAVVSMSASGGSRDATTSATITVTGTGSVSYTPDVATLNFGATSDKVTAVGATSANATAMNAIIAALKKAGATNLSTNAVSLSIRYNQGNTAIVGFEASNSVSASYAAGVVGGVIDAAVAAGATSISGPYFSSTQDQQSLYRTAMKAAVTQAQQQAALIAGDAGVALGPLVSINPTSTPGVVEAAPVGATAPAPTPVVAPQQQVTASVTLVYSLSQ